MSDRPLLLGRYRVERRIGAGGMATVYLAEDERLGRRVAVKRLHADSPQATVRRLEREARLGASLNHPNVVAVYDVGADDEGALVVMEYLEGETLAAALRRGPLPPERAMEIIRGVAAALDHAHAAGVVHRDVKPANVQLGREGETKLVDLGIAHAVDQTRLTLTGTVLGTPSYMAPEQLEGERVGPPADIYALAAVAFEALSGRRAREGGTPVEVAHRVISEPPPDLRTAWPPAGEAAAAALERGMARDPAERPASAGTLARELAAGVPMHETAETEAVPAAPTETPPEAHQPVPVPPSPPAAGTTPGAPVTLHGRRTRRRSIAAALGVAALAIAVGAALVALLAGAGSDQPSSEDQGDVASREGAGGGSGQDDGAETSAGEEAAAAEETTEAPAPPDPEEAAPAEASSPPLSAPAGEGDPARGAELNEQGKGLIDQGEPAEAVPVLQEAVASFPEGTNDINYAFALFNLGNALRLSGQAEAAIPVLERRLRIPNQRGAVRAELRRARAAADG